MNNESVGAQDRYCETPEIPIGERPVEIRSGPLNGFQQCCATFQTAIILLCCIAGAMLLATGIALIVTTNVVLGGILIGSSVVLIATAAALRCCARVQEWKAAQEEASSRDESLPPQGEASPVHDQEEDAYDSNSSSDSSYGSAYNEWCAIENMVRGWANEEGGEYAFEYFPPPRNPSNPLDADASTSSLRRGYRHYPMSAF